MYIKADLTLSGSGGADFPGGCIHWKIAESEEKNWNLLYYDYVHKNISIYSVELQQVILLQLKMYLYWFQSI